MGVPRRDLAQQQEDLGVVAVGPRGGDQQVARLVVSLRCEGCFGGQIGLLGVLLGAESSGEDQR